MLSLMYGGELCYWHRQLSAMQGTLPSSDPLGDTTASSEASSKCRDFPELCLVMNAACGSTFVDRWCGQFDAISVGVEFLKKYIDTVRNTIHGMGWDCKRADELLLQLK